MSLKASVGPVEQFLREQVGLELHQRHDRGMAEAGIGLVADVRQRLEGDRGADERAA